jgi:cob(I)alamin adenosyltransferase
MISISTKKGDLGQSSVIGKKRLDKNAPVFVVLGDLDELNSWMGVIVALLKKSKNQTKINKKLFTQLLLIQKDLFTLSAEIAGSTKVKLTAPKLKKLEKNAQEIQNSLTKDWHSKFVYPGGCEVAAWADVSRAVTRRTERALVAYFKTQKNPNFNLSLKYLNRLSDYLYLLRHQLNELEQIKEVEF